MASTTVQLRKPRSSGASSSGNKFGRPRSWTEFSTKFHAVSIPIDLTPVPKMENDVIKRREPNEYRKIRPKSASILDQTDSSSKIDGSNTDEATARPPSPKYTSFMAPNPWRNPCPKPKSPKTSPEKSAAQYPGAKVKNQWINYDETSGNCDSASDNYDEIKNAKNRKLADNTSPQAKKTVGNDQNKTKLGGDDSGIRHSASFSDTDSIDSAVVVSACSSFYGTSSGKSSNRFEFRTSGEFDSSSSISDKSSTEFGNKSPQGSKSDSRNTEREVVTAEGAQKNSQVPSKISTTNFTLDLSPKTTEFGPEFVHKGAGKTLISPKSPKTLDLPTIVVYKSDSEEVMEFCPEDKTYRFGGRNSETKPGNYSENSTVPSPLKSCYTPVAIYEDFVEYSDSENSSGDENTNSEMSRINISSNLGYDGDRSAEEYTPKTTPTPRLRQSSANGYKQNGYDVRDDNNNLNNDDKNSSEVRSGTWPRRKSKKKGETIDVEQLMKKFLETRESHLKRFHNIYADSRKRIDDVMKGLKETMTQNGYREWYPRIR